MTWEKEFLTKIFYYDWSDRVVKIHLTVFLKMNVSYYIYNISIKFT